MCAQRDALPKKHWLVNQWHQCDSPRVHSLTMMLELHDVSFTQIKFSSPKLSADPRASLLGRKHKEGLWRYSSFPDIGVEKKGNQAMETVAIISASAYWYNFHIVRRHKTPRNVCIWWEDLGQTHLDHGKPVFQGFPTSFLPMFGFSPEAVVFSQRVFCHWWAEILL